MPMVRASMMSPTAARVMGAGGEGEGEGEGEGDDEGEGGTAADREGE
jgi:hypothetical protein